MFKSLCAAALLFSLLICAMAQTSASARGITPEDYYAFEFPGDPQISPDGKLVAYVVTKVDRAQNRRNSTIWMAATDGSRAPWQFTTAPQSFTAPRWSPDGQSLAFLSSRPESTPAAAAGAASTGTAEPTRTQVYVLPMNGGEAKRITNLKNGASVFRWSPDGARLAVVSRSGLTDNRGDVRADSRDRSDVRHYKNTSYKFNDTGCSNPGGVPCNSRGRARCAPPTDHEAERSRP